MRKIMHPESLQIGSSVRSKLSSLQVCPSGSSAFAPSSLSLPLCLRFRSLRTNNSEVSKTESKTIGICLEFPWTCLGYRTLDFRLQLHHAEITVQQGRDLGATSASYREHQQGQIQTNAQFAYYQKACKLTILTNSDGFSWLPSNL